MRRSHVFILLAVVSLDARSDKVHPGAACKQKAQKDSYACHALSLSCPIEAFQSKTEPGFSVSENWLLFISATDRLCSATNLKAFDHGHDSQQNMKRLMTLGFCSSHSYKPFDPHGRGLKPSASGAPPLGPGELAPPPLDEKTDEASPAERLVSELQTMSYQSLRETPSADFLSKFRKAFGIDVKSAKALCQGTDAEKKRVVDGAENITPEFRACFQEALDRKKKLVQTCTAEALMKIPDGKDNPPVSEDTKRTLIKEALQRGGPVVVSIHNYQHVKGHSFHSLSIAGFDDEKQEFIVQNSWGKNRNYPIPYADVKKIRQISSLNCSRGTPSNTEPQDTTPHAKGRNHSY